jgi:hypothetical protein
MPAWGKLRSGETAAAAADAQGQLNVPKKEQNAKADGGTIKYKYSIIIFLSKNKIKLIFPDHFYE